MGLEFESPAGHQKRADAIRRLLFFAAPRDSNNVNAICRWHIAATSSKTGERTERCRGQIQRGERVAAVKISWVNNEQEILGTATGCYHNFCPSPARAKMQTSPFRCIYSTWLNITPQNMSSFRNKDAYFDITKNWLLQRVGRTIPLVRRIIANWIVFLIEK